MTQFPPQGYYDPTMAPPAELPRRSGLAITALVFAVIGSVACLAMIGLAGVGVPPAQLMLITGCGGCVGLVTAVVGLLLGVIGLFAIRPPKTGKGMCGVAIVLSIVATTVQVYVGKIYLIDPIRGYIAFAMTGPQEALAKAFSGDTAGFKASFEGGGATASDVEVVAFIDQLRSRFGNFTSASMDQQPGQSGPQPGQTTMTLPYNLSFGGKIVKAEVELIFVDQTRKNIVKKMGYIKVFDPALGDLVYPGSPAATAPAPSGRGGRTGTPPTTMPRPSTSAPNG